MMNTHQPFTSVAALMTVLVIVAMFTMATVTKSVTFTDPLQRLRTWSDTNIAQTSDNKPGALADLVETKTPSSMASHLTMVFMIGREVGNPETLQAILMQETNGGRSERVGNKNAPVGKRSYGLMQVQVVAARSVLERFPVILNRYFPDRKYGTIVDEEIIALLLSNDEANARIAAYHFKLYLQLSGGDWDKAVAAYCLGIGGVQKITNHSEHPYVRDVRQKLETVVRVFNRNNGLQLTQRY